MDWNKWGVSPSSRPGFLLVEALLALLLLGLASAFAVPTIWDWQQERTIDMAANELASAIREAEIEARSGSESNAASIITFYCNSDTDGRVKYETRRGAKIITPKGKLSRNICASGSLQVTFRKDSFAGSEGNSKYSMSIKTRDGTYERQIVVAMYTGRVRIVKVK